MKVASSAHEGIFMKMGVFFYKVPCLMQDHHYRMATVWQTSAYNQPPHLSYYLPDFIHDYTTDIRDINMEKADGDTTDTRVFNLMGQRVNEHYKGVIIKNGKKTEKVWRCQI